MRIALGIEYEGTEYSGWQRQKQGERTVQQTLEEALSRVADEHIGVVCAGRTDSGVHATAQVVHFDTLALRPDRAWIMGTNAHLPGDIRVCWVRPVTQEFHARFEARARSYHYVILNRRTHSALERNRVAWEYRPLALQAMQEAALHFVGEHDFSAFRAAQCQAAHPRRTVERLEITQAGEFIYLGITANAFLHHMVRNIAGTLMVIGRGEQPSHWPEELLLQRDRTLAGAMAPAAGLYLVGVRYPPVYGLPELGRVPRFS